MPQSSFDNTAYDLLVSCSEKKDFAAWNKWRETAAANVCLEGADFAGAWLKGVDLSHARLNRACLNGADLENANLERAYLCGATFNDSNMHKINLKDAHMADTHLQRANLVDACLRGANLSYSALEGANLHHAALQGADFSYAVVDGRTLLDTEKIDKNTNFTSVGLSSARVKPGLADTLSDNIRRKRWVEWYGQGNVIDRTMKRLFVLPFWWISDYGRSTRRIMLTFFLIAASSTVFYSLYPESLDNLSSAVGFCRLYRAFYFSVITMITLGFGNLNADPASFAGNTVVALQILSGYLILAALVTRISVLFTAGGPALELKKAHKKFSGS
jgi:hypothetical protein